MDDSSEKMMFPASPWMSSAARCFQNRVATSKPKFQWAKSWKLSEMHVSLVEGFPVTVDILKNMTCLPSANDVDIVDLEHVEDTSVKWTKFADEAVAVLAVVVFVHRGA